MKTFLAQSVNPPDGWFYYALSSLLVAIIVWVLIKYSNKIDRTFDRMGDNITKLTEIQIRQGLTIEFQGKEIEHLKSKI